MNEQIFLSGAPVVGFGDAASSMKLDVPKQVLLASLAGATGGAVLGALFKKGVGAAIGAVVGALGGAAFAVHTTDVAIAAWTTWVRLPITSLDTIKAGQQLALAFAMPNGAPMSSDMISKINLQFTALVTAPVNLPTTNFVQYPPGSKLPSDWPADDDLGPNAYRLIADVIANALPEAAQLKNFDLPKDQGTIKVWSRNKP
jgi:hypothetical protein